MIVVARIWWWLVLVGLLCCGGAVTWQCFYGLSGGRWVHPLRSTFRVQAWLTPLLFLLLLPILFQPGVFYWFHPQWRHAVDLVESRHAFLNVPFFTIRCIAYPLLLAFAAWMVNRADNLHAPVLIGHALTWFFLVVDWAMVREVTWYGTAFPFIVMALACMMTMSVALLRAHRDIDGDTSAMAASLLIANIFFFVYMELVAFLIIWEGDLPIDRSLYTERAHPLYMWVAVVGHLCLAVAVWRLFTHEARAALRKVQLAAWCVLAAGTCYVFWFIAPTLTLPH